MGRGRSTEERWRLRGSSRKEKNCNVTQRPTHEWKCMHMQKCLDPKEKTHTHTYILFIYKSIYIYTVWCWETLENSFPSEQPHSPLPVKDETMHKTININTHTMYTLLLHLSIIPPPWGAINQSLPKYYTLRVQAQSHTHEATHTFIKSLCIFAFKRCRDVIYS